LKRLKVSYLKIDGSLIRRVLDDIHAESLVRGLAKAAQTLGVLTVAEHVESDSVAKKLRQLEVDLAQGYFFGHPAPLARALGVAEAPGGASASSS
jgi:EAL domain-containing protein (putative c-di-GMP-specific phosphodiesterase class I)